MTDPRPTVARLREIVGQATPPCATLLVPFDPTREPFSGEGARRLRAARRTLDRRLEELGVDAERRKHFEEGLARTAEASTPPPDVRARAFLLWEDGAEAFGLPAEAADVQAEPRVVVGTGFALRPLLRAARHSGSFLVVAVSANRVALHASTEDGRDLRELARDDLPASLEDALGHDLGQRPDELQWHSTRAHGSAPTYHGQGGAADERHGDLERFHRVLGAALRDRLRGEERPVVIAADRTHQAALREEMAGLPVLEEGVVGSPDHRASHALAADAGEVVARWRAARDALLAEELERARARGKAAVGLEETLRAVAMGRAHRLFVPAVGAHPGRVDAAALRAVAPWGDEDLADELAALAIRQGGEVVPWEHGRPPAEGVDFAAVLR